MCVAEETLQVCCFAERWFPVPLQRGLWENQTTTKTLAPGSQNLVFESVSIDFGVVSLQESQKKFCSESNETCVEGAVTLHMCHTQHTEDIIPTV